MAVKDHMLDGKIISAAKAEFLEHGFQKASLHKIASRAGITTGALYTRYKSKDDLFCSLIRGTLSEIGSHFKLIQENYDSVHVSSSPDRLLEAIHKEAVIYLDLMFEHYEECILFFCKSDGSSIQTMIEKMMEKKSGDTIAFLKSIAKPDAHVNFDGIELILMEQFRYYRIVLEKRYTKEQALSCMETVEAFLEAGWKSLFERIL